MESLSYWVLFFSAALAINISPGPDLIYILSKTIAGGRKVGVASSLGVCTGAMVHVFAAVRTTRFFRKNRRAFLRLDRLLGSVLVGLGLRLAFPDNHHS